MTTDNDSTILAALLGPGSVSTQLQGGIHVQVNATTMYPFSSEITYAIKADGACQFGFRVPGYVSGSVSYKVNNDSSKSTEPNKNGIVKIAVDSGDTTVTVNIPMKTKIVERPNGAVAVQHGPLTYALPINYTSDIIHKYYVSVSVLLRITCLTYTHNIDTTYRKGLWITPLPILRDGSMQLIRHLSSIMEMQHQFPQFLLLLLILLLL